MIVQDQADRTAGRIIGVQILEQPDELDAPVPLLDAGDDVSIKQVQARQNRQGPMPDILMIASESGVFAGDGRKVRSGIGDRLHTRFLIHRNRDDVGPPAVRRFGSFVLRRYLLVDQQDFRIVASKLGSRRSRQYLIL